jgi:LysM repeat protein
LIFQDLNMRAKIILVQLIFIFLCREACCTNLNTPQDSIGVTRINGKLHIRYMVSPGETIYGVSTAHRTSVSDLLELNPELENGLKVGQIILIPYTSTTEKKASNTSLLSAPESAEKKNAKKIVHTVLPGETLFSLAKKYNVSVDNLMRWNNIDLKAGQQIVIESTLISPDSDKSVPALTEISEKGTLGEPKEVKKETEIVNKYDYDSSMQQILIIPFDPYLYFSDADDEIAARSNIPRTKVRQVFRRRMNALLDHPAYENIHLLGGKAQDSITDLNKIYSSVTYNYQEILYNPNYVSPAGTSRPQAKKADKNWLERQKEKIIPEAATNKSNTPKDEGKYFGVIVKNPVFFTYFNNKYDIDYYIFINQFEVKTDYENCLDRAAQNYERTFTTHYSIFDATGKQIAGNKFRTHYNSNSNSVNQIVSDNMQKITDHILADLPLPRK